MPGSGAALSFERLLDWVEGRLDPVAAAEVAACLDGADAATLATLEWIRGFQRSASAMVFESPPAQVREALRHRFAAAYPPEPAFVERLRAALRFDSWTAVGLAGARGADLAEAERHLVFSVPGLDLAVDVYPAGEGMARVEGQLLPLSGTGAAIREVRLVAEGTVVGEADADPHGSFAFLLPVPTGRYALELAGPPAVVVDLDLGSGRPEEAREGTG